MYAMLQQSILLQHGSTMVLKNMFQLKDLRSLSRAIHTLTAQALHTCTVLGMEYLEGVTAILGSPLQTEGCTGKAVQALLRPCS